MKQKEIFHFPLREKEQIKSVFADREPIKQERLSTAEIELLSDQLKQLMNTEKCFLNPDLELPTLASKINLTPHELSYLLNKGLHCNFFELVNSYRVEEAKRLLLSNQHNHLNILGIAYESGFNSKTTFNTAFKKVTGLSPSQFKKTQLTEIAVVSPSQN